MSIFESKIPPKWPFWASWDPPPKWLKNDHFGSLPRKFLIKKWSKSDFYQKVAFWPFLTKNLRGKALKWPFLAIFGQPKNAHFWANPKMTIFDQFLPKTWSGKGLSPQNPVKKGQNDPFLAGFWGLSPLSDQFLVKNWSKKCQKWHFLASFWPKTDRANALVPKTQPKRAQNPSQVPDTCMVWPKKVPFLEFFGQKHACIGHFLGWVLTGFWPSPTKPSQKWQILSKKC